MDVRNDIITRHDIELLVDRFYQKVEAHALLGPLFANIDWVKHKPIMYSFWSTMMLGEQSYRRNPFEKHVALPLTATHFSDWLSLFVETVDESFQGDKALEIKQRARTIAGVWQFKLGINE